MIRSVVLYGSKTWTMRKEDINRLEAFEMWIWRRMERISWMERRTNDEIHQMVDEKRSLIRVTRSRQRNWLGHILRGDSLLRTIIEGRMEGKKKRGRLRIIHSFIPGISIAPLQVLHYSEALPTTARILYRSFTRSAQATVGKGLALCGG